jgi:hypothetical protein
MSASTLQRSFAWLLIAACVGCATPDVNETRTAPEPVPAQPRSVPPAPIPAPPSQAPTPPPAPAKAEQELARGIQSYDDGEHKLATKHLQSALALGLEAKRDQAKAHKYLAFTVCVSGREKACRDQFRKALDADPGFALEPAEAGNPVWSAALRAVKAERAAKAKKEKSK